MFVDALLIVDAFSSAFSSELSSPECALKWEGVEPPRPVFTIESEKNNEKQKPHFNISLETWVYFFY